jgi:hypothetical protein
MLAIRTALEAAGVIFLADGETVGGGLGVRFAELKRADNDDGR